MKNWKADKDFQEHTITKVEENTGDGWAITHSDGMSIWVPKESPVVPAVGMTVRFYPKGAFSAVRGMVIDDKCVYYRTEEEDKEHREIELYGKDAADWVARWDAGQSVFSISMGGLGPGYEQCIQIVAVEVVRAMLKIGETWWNEGSDDANNAKWRVIRDKVDKIVSPITAPLGLSGAQWGAGLSLAGHVYRKGPRAIMNDEAVKDRHIQVSREMPSLATA